MAESCRNEFLQEIFKTNGKNRFFAKVFLIAGRQQPREAL